MNRTKFKEAILYVSQKCESDVTYGATKLNNVLFAADMMAYFSRGRAITGVDYMKLQMGPAPRQLVPVRDEMVLQGELEIKLVPCGEYVQKRPVARREPDLSVFKADDLAYLDEAIKGLRGHYASVVSEWSHGFIGWRIADEGENIPYEACLIDPGALTEDDLAWGRRVADGLA